MKKIILSTLLIILSGVIFSACNKTDNQAAVTQEEAPIAEQQEDGGSFTGNIKDLMGFNKTQKCTWTAPDQGEGTVYVSGRKTRSEISMVAMEGQPAQQMFSISDDEWAYSWNPVTKKGMKVKVEEMDEEVTDIEEYKTDNWDDDSDADYQETIDDQDYAFKCESWRADSKMFVPPTDVEFVDMNAMMENMRQGAQQGQSEAEVKQNLKGICEMLTGEDKTECLAGFED